MYNRAPEPPAAAETIDDLRNEPPRSSVGTDWELISDRVMGGVSTGSLARTTVAKREALRLTGQVRLENNGGFVQAALDLGRNGATVNARHWAGVQMDVFGNGQDYNMHLRTADIRRPWESFRQSFTANAEWATVRLPFDGFLPHRTPFALDVARLRRLGLVAIGRAFEADLAIADIRFYAASPGEKHSRSESAF